MASKAEDKLYSSRLSTVVTNYDVESAGSNETDVLSLSINLMGFIFVLNTVVNKINRDGL